MIMFTAKIIFSTHTDYCMCVCVCAFLILIMYFQFRVCSRPDVFSDTAYALSVGMSIIGYYENFFGVEYPLPKQG